MQTLGIGAWSKVGKGCCIQAATDSQNPNSNIEAGLPDIQGTFWDLASTVTTPYMGNCTGSFYSGTEPTSAVRYVIGSYLQDAPGKAADGIGFTASKSNATYGKSDTVQPPAYLVHIWRRTA